MRWILAFHIISMVAWFAGLFYLPRLFVYHAETKDEISWFRFQTMEHRLYYFIMWPAGLATSLLGLVLLFYFPFYLKAGWMHAKLFCVACLWFYHLTCGHFIKQFACTPLLSIRSHKFYRFFNEIPTIFLIAIICLTIIKPY